jgi:hypothetical protein
VSPRGDCTEPVLSLVATLIAADNLLWRVASWIASYTFVAVTGDLRRVAEQVRGVECEGHSPNTDAVVPRRRRRHGLSTLALEFDGGRLRLNDRFTTASATASDPGGSRGAAARPTQVRKPRPMPDSAARNPTEASIDAPQKCLT